MMIYKPKYINLYEIKYMHVFRTKNKNIHMNTTQKILTNFNIFKRKWEKNAFKS